MTRAAGPIVFGVAAEHVGMAVALPLIAVSSLANLVVFALLDRV